MRKWPEESLWSWKVCFKCDPTLLGTYQSEAKHLKKDEKWMFKRIKADWQFAMVGCQHFEAETCPYLTEHMVSIGVQDNGR
jgi:hypothetical protein